MGLTKYRIGKFVKLHNVACGIPNLSSDDVSGVGRDKEFFEPSKQVGADTTKYKVVPPDYFACNLMHVGRDVVLPIALNKTDHNKYVSPAYSIFKITDESIVLKEYFLMKMVSEEQDRYFWFHTDSSVRDGLSWDEFCALEIELPDIPTQQKYVDVYKAMVANQQSYEKGLDDLKLVYELHFEHAKKHNLLPLGEVIERVDARNSENIYGADDVFGINNNKEFISTKAEIIGKDLSRFIVIENNEFGYNSRTDGRDMLVLALNRDKKAKIVTFNYSAFRIKDNLKQYINPEYLYAFLKRKEFDRRVRFMSWGSSQELLTWDNLCAINVPCPDISVQNSIAEISRLFIQTKNINERLKAQIKNICPVLIRGSIQEGSRTA